MAAKIAQILMVVELDAGTTFRPASNPLTRDRSACSSPGGSHGPDLRLARKQSPIQKGNLAY